MKPSPGQAGAKARAASARLSFRTGVLQEAEIILSKENLTESGIGSGPRQRTDQRTDESK
jgi:hypothetical protein